MIASQLIAALDQLSPNLQTEVLNYAEYLVAKYNQTPEEKETPRTYRQAGSMKGMFKMADDFDTPLEDFQEYM